MSGPIGQWCELENGWIVGPIVEVGVEKALYVKFGKGVWSLDAPDYKGESARRIKRIATREELVKS